MQNQKIEYQDENITLEGYLAYNSKISGKRPLILIVHDWSGCNEFAQKKAEAIAELGYVGFAIDMFGKGKLGKTKEEKSQLIKPFMENRKLLRQRIIAAFTIAQKLEIVDTQRIAVMGFCFGGLCALDLARTGANIRGAVSFHGLLGTPANITQASIKAKILALHGHDDPMVPPEQVLAFQKEMTAASADWQMHIYGNTMHAFMNPVANDPDFGTVYNKSAETRAWQAMKNFFAEIFQ